MDNTNGKRRLALADLDEIEPEPAQSDAFYDSRNPVFAPAKPLDKAKKRSWRRKLIRSGIILLLLGAAAFALYSLLKINRVNVRVQADARRDGPNAKPQASPNNSENGLSAEAINIARAAIGTDAPAANANPTASPGSSPSTSPVASPSPGGNFGRNLSTTVNSVGYGPTYDPVAAITDSKPSASSTTAIQQQSKSGELPTTEIALQSRANSTQTIFVDDPPPRPLMSPARIEPMRLESRLEKKMAVTTKTVSPAVLPPFGTMLPVRTQGVVFTLRNNSYARLELTRDSQGEGWSLPKGTILIGHVSGSEYDRAFVGVIGYVDPRDNRFVKMTGEVLGSDGGSGIQGKRVVVDRNRLKQTLRKVASSGMQVAGMMAGALGGRGTVVIDGAGYRMMNPVTDEATYILNGRGDDKRGFVKVEAGRPGYVMVSDLPKNIPAVDAPGETDLAHAAISLSDREVMEMIVFGTPEEIRTALPLMTEEQKRLTLKAMPENETR